MINYCSVHVSRHTLDIHKCLEQTYESGNPFKIVDCNENLPYANPLKRKTFRNAQNSTLRMFARKTCTIQIFFILWLQSDNELPMSEMQKNWGVTDFVFKIKRVENYPNFDKSALATRHGLSAC